MAEAELGEGASTSPTSSMRCAHRSPGDDFFCLRYQVWYSSLDCAIRTRYRTSAGCANCEQGRFNLKRHEQSLARKRFVPLEP